jgi:homoaconitase/3-isopropylmalate dehydratase large subunit
VSSTPIHKRSVHGHLSQRVKKWNGRPPKMIYTPTEIRDEQQALIPGTRALLWGNNAAWICQSCGELLGGRTGNIELHVTCDSCRAPYTILRVKSRQGAYHLGAAAGVQVGTVEGNIDQEQWLRWNT